MIKNIKKILPTAFISMGLFVPAAYAFAKPIVTVTTYSLDSVGLKKIDSTIFLNIENPNGIGLDLKKVEYKVNINSVENVAEGSTIKSITVLKDSKINPIEVPVSVNNSKIFPTLTSIVKSPEKINYTVTGKVYFGTFLGDIPIPFSRTSYLDNTESIQKMKTQIKSMSIFNLF